MKRKLVGLALFSFVLFGAILAGYWDMLNAEKLRVVRDQASDAVGEIAAIVRSAPEPETQTPAAGNAEVGSAPAEPVSPAGSASLEGSTPDSTAALDAIPDEAEAPGAEAAAPAGDPVPPTFDILRVDPDGSMVLAGRAPAGAEVALRNGGEVLGEERANTAGEFVVVLEKPLGVGEHQIKIEATLADGTNVASSETAIVSIPESGREDELLAMVEAPDQASRLITVPTGRPPAETLVAPADPEVAAAPVPEAGTGLTLPDAKADAPSDAIGATAAAPEANGSVLPKTEAPVLLAVEAIEIEDETVYVAGRAESAASVRVYIDNGFLAEAPVRSGDRFLITAGADVAPGEHTVRADALNGAGAVVARVEVPFSRPEGRAMAALAPPREESRPEATLPGESAPASVPAGPSVQAPDSPLAPSDSAPSNSALGEPLDASLPEPTSSDEPSAAVRQPERSTPQVPPSASVPETATGAPVTAPAAAGAPSIVRSTPSPTPASPTSPVAELARPDAAPTEPTAPDAVPTIRQPALESVASRVIIRRGDTLWRISRETYGRGARYTVIYLANGDQIRDPDRIYPGQVFRMPEDDLAGSEAPRG